MHLLVRKARMFKMKNKRDGVKEIEKVCMAVLNLEIEDFAEMDRVAQKQCEYAHPLKMATARWQNELGEHNKKVMEELKNLRNVLKDGAKIQKP